MANNDSQAKARFKLFTLTLVLMFPTTINAIFTPQYNILLATKLGPNPSSQSLTDIIRQFVVIGDRLTYVVGDAIVVWRSWILFPGDLVVQMILTICMLGTTAAIVLDLLMEQHLAINIDSKVLIGIVYLIPPLITHLVTTVLIAYKTYCYYVDIKGNLIASDSSRTRVQKILVLLIESGFIYCIFWTLGVIEFEFTNDTQPAIETFLDEIYSSARPLIAALYPVLIILIAAIEKSDEGSENELSLSQSIRFASRSTNLTSLRIRTNHLEDPEPRSSVTLDNGTQKLVGFCNDNSAISLVMNKDARI